MGPNLSSSKEHFREELQMLAWQLKRRFLPSFNLWIANLS
jgi:hypothetical protein